MVATHLMFKQTFQKIKRKMMLPRGKELWKWNMRNELKNKNRKIF